MPTDTRTANARYFDEVIELTARSASDVRKACKATDVNVKELDSEAVAILIDYLKPKCTACKLHHGLHPDVRLCPTGYTTKETSDMPALNPNLPTSDPRRGDAPAEQTARKRTGSTTRTAKAATTGLSAAQVARDNELDPRKFRAFLRSAGVDRTFANKTAATKAVKAFKKSQS